LKFFIDGQGFFVDCLLFFARNLEIADSALEFRSRGLKLLLQFESRSRIAKCQQCAELLPLPVAVSIVGASVYDPVERNLYQPAILQRDGLGRDLRVPVERGQNGRSQVPVALTTARATQEPRSVTTSSRPSPFSRTDVTRTGRITGSEFALSNAAKYSATTSDAGRSESGLPSGKSGRSWMPCTLPSRSDGQRCCQAPPAPAAPSSRTCETP